MRSSTHNSRESLGPQRLSAWPPPSPWAESWSAHAEFVCGASYGSSDIGVAAMLFLEAIRARYGEELLNTEAVRPG